MAKGKKKTKSKARPKKTKKKSFLLFPKFFQKWSLIFIGLFALLGLLASLNFPRLTMEKNMTSTDETTVAFIAEIGETSRYLAARNDLYASVMIAQAILESDSGQSQLSQKPLYNFFGIKGEYNGQSVTPVSYTHLDVYKRQDQCHKLVSTSFFHVRLVLNTLSSS